MATRRKSQKLKSSHLFVISVIVGAVATLIFQFATTATRATDIPGPFDPRLAQAATASDMNSLQALLEQGIDINSTTGDGSTALHWAAHLNDQEMTAFLLDNAAGVNIATDLGVTPLWLAAENGSDTIIRSLLDAAADPNPKLLSGETPLMMASRSGNPLAVQLLIEHGATVDAVENSQQQTALMWAAAQRHAEVVRILLSAGANFAARSSTWVEVVQPAGAIPAVRDAIYEIVQGGFTALLFAAQQGDVAVAQALLLSGADVNDKAADGTSALVIAAHSGNGELARLLLDSGADPNLMGSGYAALHIAIGHQDLALVKALIAAGANVNAAVISPTPARRDGRDHAISEQLVNTTPFWIAAQYRQTEILKELIAAGADTSFTTESQDTVLMLAIDGREAFFKEETRGLVDPAEGERQALKLIAYALEIGVDINARNSNGDTALHKAAARGYDGIVQYLAEHGAELEAVNARGMTPLAYAMRLRGRGVGESASSNISTEQLLKNLGATL